MRLGLHRSDGHAFGALPARHGMEQRMDKDGDRGVRLFTPVVEDANLKSDLLSAHQIHWTCFPLRPRRKNDLLFDLAETVIRRKHVSLQRRPRAEIASGLLAAADCRFVKTNC
jgi:hypothetical protein